ncbi:DUF2182 domain-containing protein [Undibacterium sp. TC4M20W]|uniref:copper chaperone n=1 Tax=Undibacterium sp. TC4M20W TaxID=3413052 RepID=UPI003BF06ECE
MLFATLFAILRAALLSCPRPLLLISLAGWLGLAALQFGVRVPEYCGSLANIDLAYLANIGDRLVFVWHTNSRPTMMANWLLMLLAMMSPLLAQEMTYLWQRSLARRRLRALLLFVIAYLLIWSLAGAFIMLASLVLRLVIGDMRWCFAILLALALLWQISPAKQYCLNRCHSRPRLAAFGWQADRDSLRYGLQAAFWCGGTCWAWMLAATAAGPAHFPFMLITSAWLLIDRQAPGRVPAWQLPYSLRWYRPA